jgi:hypothetical protein
MFSSSSPGPVSGHPPQGHEGGLRFSTGGVRFPHREIPLSRGFVAIVDEADYERASAWTWTSGGTATAPRPVHHYWEGGKKKKVQLGRWLLNAPADLCVDHINGDPLDNRRCNLRICTPRENSINRRGTLRSNPYRGVRSARHRWRAHIAGRHIGSFATAEEAARAYDAAARIEFGEFANLNFPHLEEAA